MIYIRLPLFLLNRRTAKAVRSFAVLENLFARLC